MVSDSWLPIKYMVCANVCVGKVLYSAENWQIVDGGDKKILLTCQSLMENWYKSKLVDVSQFIRIDFGENTFFAMVTDSEYDLSPIEESQQCHNLSNALAFANAMKSTRAIIKNISFKDAIYVEACNRLLPTYTLAQELEDEIVLGYWLTGGVIISVTSFRRLCLLMTWLKPEDVSRVIEIAGLNVQGEIDDDHIDKQVECIDTQTLDTQNTQLSTVTQNFGYFSLPGRPQLEIFFNEQIIDIVNNLEAYQRMGIDFPAPTILYGPPGSGKTYAVEQLANFLDWPVFYIDSSSIASSYIHDTSKKIAEVFEKARKNAPAIIIIDEMEAYLSSRNMGGESGMHHIEEVAEFLREIPNASKNHILVFGMTNMIESLDAAAIRQGRFDHKIEVGLPSKEDVTALVNATCQKLPMEQNINFNKAIEILTNRPFSDLAFMFREAGRLAVKNNLMTIDQKCLDNALDAIPSNKQRKSPFGFCL